MMSSASNFRRSRRDTDPIQQHARALQEAAESRPRMWGWNFCQVSTTVTPKEIGGTEAYTVAVDVNGMPHALLAYEEVSGQAYTVWWRLDYKTAPMCLGHFNDPNEALGHAEQVIADVAAGLRKIDGSTK